MKDLSDLSVRVEGDDVLTAASFPIRIDQRAMARNIEARNRMLNFFEGTQWEFTMKRQEWTVPYTGDQLADAAFKKAAYHAQRKTWWQEVKDAQIAKIRESGITINESIVDELSKTGYANTMMGTRHGGGPQVQIDESMQLHLGEAHEKVKAHEGLVKEYDAWNQMMSAHKTASFSLTQADWMYFFGK